MKAFKVTEEQLKVAKEKIEKFNKKHPNVELGQLDRVAIFNFKTINGLRAAHFYIPTTGEYGTRDFVDLTNTISKKNGSGINMPYAYYDRELNVIQFSLLYMPSTVKKDDEKVRYPLFNEKYYMVDGNKAVFNEYGNHVDEGLIDITYHSSNSGYYHKRLSIRAVFNLFASNSIYKNKSKSFEDFADYAGDVEIGWSKKEIGRAESWCDIAQWSIRKTSIKKKVGADDLENIRFDKYNMKESPKWGNTMNRKCHIYKSYMTVDGSHYIKIDLHDSIAHFEKINDDLAVFRIFVEKQENYSSEEIVTVEQQRLFIDNGRYKLYSRTKTRDGIKYVRNNRVNILQYVEQAILDNVDDVFAFDKFKYFKDMVSTVDPVGVMGTILQSAKHPIIEQLTKMGYVHIARFLLGNNTINANLRDYYAVNTKNAKETFKMLGLNKYQLELSNNLLSEYYMNIRLRNDSYYSYSYNSDRFAWFPSFLKTMAGADNASSLSKEDTDLYYKVFQYAYEIGLWYRGGRWGSRSNFITAFIPSGSGLTIDESKKFAVKYYKKALDMPKDIGIQYLRTMKDVISSYNVLNDRPRIDFKIYDLEHAAIIHDNLIELVNRQREEQRALWDAQAKMDAEKKEELRKKVDEKRKVWEYENDDYIIKLPDRLADIVSEGSALHHCVAGYVNRHAIGNTTIMFLRNKQDIDSPWFTIEVNHGDIIQIHGFANKWLSSDDDGYKAVPFVWNWIKKNNFSCNKNILLNMAQGYCAGSAQREWPAECK